MNRTLIAIVTAGLLASGAAVAGSVHSLGDNHSGNFIAVQYGYGYDRSDEPVFRSRADDTLGQKDHLGLTLQAVALF